MRRLDWLFAAIIAAFLASAVVAQLIGWDEAAPVRLSEVRPVVHFASFPAKSHPVRALCPTPPRRA